MGRTTITPYIEVVVLTSKMPGRLQGFVGMVLVKLGARVLKGKSHIILNSAGELREVRAANRNSAT